MQGFVESRTAFGAQVYTDEAAANVDIDRLYKAVKHSVDECVDGMAHTNGLESLWAMLKRGYHGVYHHISAKHLYRYVAEFAGRRNIRGENTMDQMMEAVTRMVGKRRMYRDLVS